MKPVTRQKLNITIDIIMFLVMVALAVIGFIIRYILIPGSERWEKYGRNVDLTCWGLDRHEWGFIHLILGISLVVLLILHIIFHWAMIVCYIKRLLPKLFWRYTVVGGMIILSCIFIAAPFYLSPEIGAPIRGQGEGYWPIHSEDAVTPDVSSANADLVDIFDEEKVVLSADEAEEVKAEEKQSHEKEVRVLDIKGFNTIGELASLHGISPTELKKRLNIPSGVSDNEQLGRIRRIYGFTMREVEDCILALKDQLK
jgi:hypothetical protein